jgi:cytochrome c biogenesis protein CcmG/thiol:disulfide interchange protein DsbE
VNRLCFVLLLTLALLAAGCDRGAHPGQIGQPAPTFTVTDAQHTVSLESLRGRVVVLNFWATWCPPCVDELPSLMAMQARLRDRGVTVLAVSLDSNQEQYLKFLHDHNVDLLTVRDPQQKSNALYGTFAFPETYIIDPQGVVRRKFIGPVDWTKPEIMEYLGKLSVTATAPPSATAVRSQ